MFLEDKDNFKGRDYMIIKKVQLNKEKNDINRELNYKNNIKNEMNKININLLKAKKLKENKKIKLKKNEKEYITYLCKKQIDDFIARTKQKKMIYNPKRQLFFASIVTTAIFCANNYLFRLGVSIIFLIFADKTLYNYDFHRTSKRHFPSGYP